MNFLSNRCRSDHFPVHFLVVANTTRKLVLLSSFIICFASDRAQGDEQYVPDRISFKRDVRPIFSDHCFACHGPDANRREADLRLDTQQGSMSAIQAGDASKSELMLRIFSHDDEVRMPPPMSNKKLSTEQVVSMFYVDVLWGQMF